jgi:hypothetical protein
MVRSLVLLGIATQFATGAGSPTREVTSEAAELGGMLIPAYYKGYIYWAGRDPLGIYTPDGHPLYIPTPNGNVQAVAGDTDGALAVAWNTHPGAGVIEIYNRSGALTRTIQTGRYLPMHLAYDDNHFLWAFGWQIMAGTPNRVHDSADYMSVRKFSTDGELVGSYLPRSLFPKGFDPGYQSWQRSNCITVSHDRIGLWTASGMNSSLTEWVELDFNGNITGRWRLDAFHYDLRVAFTSDSHIFISISMSRPKPARC